MKHIPVMLKQAMLSLNIKPEGVYADLTAGSGGHSQAILDHLTSGHLFCIDRDPKAIQHIRNVLKPGTSHLHIIHSKFSHYSMELPNLDGALIDLGPSRDQLTDPNRGFSFRGEGLLDMRMDPTDEHALTAKQLLEEITIDDLDYALEHISDEPYHYSLAVEIKKNIQVIHTTQDLINIAYRVIGSRRKQHPALLLLQTLRILVNQEFDELIKTLPVIWEKMRPNGKLVILTFHSTEDRLVKQFKKLVCSFAQNNNHLITTPNVFSAHCSKHISSGKVQVIKPDTREMNFNRSSRTAKLYCFTKL